MKHISIRTSLFTNNYILFSFGIIISFFVGCSSADNNLKVAGFRFEYQGDDYFIRSVYCDNNAESCNHLIGKNFQAVDANQDRVIDEIIRGDVELAKAQEIYDYSLDLLKKENKLNEVADTEDDPKFSIKNPNIVFEITSFNKEGKEPYNQFKIVEHRIGTGDQITIFNDKNADGSLDEKLQGEFMVPEAQKLYEEIIAEGISAAKIEKKNNIICVK